MYKISDFCQYSATLNVVIMGYFDNIYDMGAIFDGFEIDLYVYVMMAWSANALCLSICDTLYLYL